MEYIGMALGKRESQIAILMEDGELVDKHRLCFRREEGPRGPARQPSAPAVPKRLRSGKS